MDELLGGFVINSVYQFQTGQPLVFTNDLMVAPGVQLRQIGLQARNTNTTASGNPALGINSFVTGTATVPTIASCNSAPASCDGTTSINNGTYVNHYPHPAADALVGQAGRVQQYGRIDPEELQLL